MKNADMKIIAIILSIALLFTLITSNAVSIAAISLLAGGETTDAGESTGDDATGDDATSEDSYEEEYEEEYVEGEDVATDDGATSDDDATSDDATTSDDAADKGDDATADKGDDTAADKGDDTAADKGGDTSADKGTSTTTNAIEKTPLAAYKKAAKEINEKGVAGYTKKSWQGITRDLKLTKLDFLSGTLTSLIKSFMTAEADAEEKVSAKGSDDAKNRMPSSQISNKYIKSVNVTKSGSNYVVKIVLKDQTNPRKADTDGLNIMSRDILYIEDVEDTIKNDATVSKVVKSLNKGEITYKAYTITATMTADGKFVDITHYSDADLVADITAVAGSLGGSGGLSFNVHYYDFKY